MSNPFHNRDADQPAAEPSGVTPWVKPDKQSKEEIKAAKAAAKAKKYGARDPRWFTRLVGWIVTIMALAMMSMGLLARNEPSVEGDFLTTATMFLMAGVPLLLAGLYLLYWGYTAYGEPMVACAKCFHVNKPRSTTCKKCGAGLG